MESDLKFNERFVELLMAKLSKKTTWGRNEVERLILEAQGQVAIDLLREITGARCTTMLPTE